MCAATSTPSVVGESENDPPLAAVPGRHYRIVSSMHPPVALFEGLVAPERMAEVFELEAITNDRLREPVGRLHLVRPEDRLSAPGASPVMSAFTQVSVHRPSRFSDGTYGVHYVGRSLETAISETRHHRERFMAATAEAPGELDLQVYVGEVARPLHDLRGAGFEDLHTAHDWRAGQRCGWRLRAKGSWGVVYRSVRHTGGECIGALRPPAVTIPRPSIHLGYVWDGERIIRVYHKRLLTPHPR
ncbi:MAG: RES family NAD+ phosphorylase [Nitrococcus sp.]|nr:RES family NAD+ phosphorylase [Nitrococcus sp.]